MGESYKTPGLTANQIISERFPASLQLGLQAVAVGLILGLILGILAALHRGRWIDFLTIFVAIIGGVCPELRVRGSASRNTPQVLISPSSALSSKGMGVGQIFQYTFLPTVSASISGIATYSRFMRSSVLDVLSNDYILLAKSKGLSNFQIVNSCCSVMPSPRSSPSWLRR